MRYCISLPYVLLGVHSTKGIQVVRAWLLKDGRIDRLAMGLAGACLAHCVGTAVFVATLASASSILLAPAIHETGLALAILLGAIALGHGALKRGDRKSTRLNSSH